MDFYDMLKAKAIGDSGGGDTPSPSGDAHFSKFSVMDWWGSETCYMDNTGGIYTLPDAETTFPRSGGYGVIILVSPVKTITGIENLDDKYFVQFTPDEDFHVDFEFTGTVTEGDGKVYMLVYENDKYKITTDGVDFYASIS